MHPCPRPRANAGIQEQQVKLRPGTGRDTCIIQTNAKLVLLKLMQTLHPLLYYFPPTYNGGEKS